MAWDIDKAHANCAAVWRGEFEVGKSDIDGDAAPFFFFQAIGINARQGFDQGGLAVIDMSGGSNDDATCAISFSPGSNGMDGSRPPCDSQSPAHFGLFGTDRKSVV